MLASNPWHCWNIMEIHILLKIKLHNNNNNNSVYLLSAHSIRFYAHGANYYYPGYARPSQRRTRQTMKNPTGTHLLHLGRERQLWIKLIINWSYSYFMNSSAVLSQGHKIKLFNNFLNNLFSFQPNLFPHNAWRLFHIQNHYWTIPLKVLGKSVGLCKTSKRKDQLYISLLVFVWRINWKFQPKRTHISWDMNENINKENKKNSGFGDSHHYHK